MRTCELCGNPVQLVDLHEGAVVYHFDCLKEHMAEIQRRDSLSGFRSDV